MKKTEISIKQGNRHFLSLGQCMGYPVKTNSLLNSNGHLNMIIERKKKRTKKAECVNVSKRDSSECELRIEDGKI